MSASCALAQGFVAEAFPSPAERNSQDNSINLKRILLAQEVLLVKVLLIFLQLHGLG